ncbi:hypothetical protein [Methylocaldum szegediense]|jgi:hypothetical protein|uniref:Uncharacterized protein n=1 Tax=Methylocaldum szegediense TaxID=73780 RepID=A0ABM9I0N3_9GAMM|nr:hypothetical protein [Methylocaldum szegediense]CAI8812343.1 protein of unknown function [Methylocaldum szegediense]
MRNERSVFAEFRDIYQMETDFVKKIEAEFDEMIEEALIESESAPRLAGLGGAETATRTHVTLPWWNRAVIPYGRVIFARQAHDEGTLCSCTQA